MGVCSHCGAQLHGDERFCVACGTAVPVAAPGANGGAVAGPPPPPMPVPPAPVLAPPVQQMAVAGGYALHGPGPVAAGGTEAPATSGGKMWTWIAIAAILLLGYSYLKNKTATATPPAAPAQPAGTAPAGAPAQQGTAGQPVTSGPVLQQQTFAGHWQAIYGFVEVTNTSWTNHSAAAMQSATLECDQYSANGSLLSQMRTTLNGPVQPGGTGTFNPFQMGSVSTYMSRVNCFIVAVTPAN